MSECAQKVPLHRLECGSFVVVAKGASDGETRPTKRTVPLMNFHPKIVALQGSLMTLEEAGSRATVVKSRGCIFLSLVAFLR